MPFGLKDKDIECIKNVLQLNAKINEAIIFGSRAMSTEKLGSDIDIALKGNGINQTDINKLNIKLDDQPIAYDFDFIIYNEIKTPELTKHIDKHGISFYEKEILPSEWKTYKLSEIAQMIGGGTPKTTVEEYWNGDIPWLSVVDFGKSAKTVYNTEKSITEKGLKESSTKILKKGQLIISARGTVGELAMLGRDMAFNQSCYGLTATKETTNEFLYYLVKDSVGKIKQNTHGAVFDTITKQTFENIEVTIPESLNTQSQIAQILTSLDDKIELNLQMNQTLEATAQALFKEWFVNFNFPNFDGELENGLPIGWRMGTVKEMYKTSSGGTPSRAKEDYYENGTINWVKSKELNGSFIFDTEEKITVNAVKNSSAKLIPKYSVLVAMYGATVGEYAITTRDTTCNQAICAVIENGSYPFTYFFEYFKINRNNIISQASGSAQQNISQALIQQLEILVPPVEVVKKYHSVVESMFIKMENNLLQIQSLTQTRDTLLPKLMSGKIEIKN